MDNITRTSQTTAYVITRNEDGIRSVAGYHSSCLLESAACKAEPESVWSYVARSLTVALTGPTGKRNAASYVAIHLAFHNAGSWFSSLISSLQGRFLVMLMEALFLQRVLIGQSKSSEYHRTDFDMVKDVQL